MIVIASGENLRNIDCPKTEEAAKRITDRFNRHGIPYKVEFF